MTVDAYAVGQGHLDHCAPIWKALAPEARGTFYVGEMAHSFRWAESLGLDPQPGIPSWSDRPVLIATGNDLNLVKRPILIEHGSGQTYIGVDHPCWPGGYGRDSVILFLVPNDRVAEANLATYPNANVEVVGSPHVEVLRAQPPYPQERHRIALSAHWASYIVEEARSGWAHYEDAFREACEMAPDDFVIHGHPRMQDYTGGLAAKWGVEFEPDFTHLTQRAWLYVVDSSSTAFEWMALDRPVIFYSPPWFRRDVHHGGRFWEWVDAGVHVEKPEDLESAFLTALADPKPIRQRRMTVARYLWGHDLSHGASARAARAVEEML